MKIGTTVNQKRLFFNLSKTKRRLLTLQEGDLRPDEVTLVANRLRVTEQDVIEMNRRLSGDVSISMHRLNVEGDPIEWQDRLIDESSDQESRLAERDDLASRKKGAWVGAYRAGQARTLHLRGAPAHRSAALARRARHKFGVSPERIRQIEARAFKRVQEAVHVGERRDGMLNYPGAA